MALAWALPRELLLLVARDVFALGAFHLRTMSTGRARAFGEDLDV